MSNGSGSPRSSCRLSGKLGRDGSVGVSAFSFRSVPFRSVSRAADVLRYSVFPFRFPCHAVSPYRRIADPSPRSSCRVAGREATRLGPRITRRYRISRAVAPFLVARRSPVPSGRVEGRGGWMRYRIRVIVSSVWISDFYICFRIKSHIIYRRKNARSRKRERDVRER